MDEYPEVTQADFDRAIFRQRLKPVEKKQRITIMLDVGIISYYKAKAGQRGYQTLINDTLRKAITSDIPIQPGFEQMLRNIIREELLATERV
ncbi:MAG: BrnA antitoxin family protein [Chloroflexota bacterium]